MRILLLLLLSAGLVWAQEYDLLLKGGHLIDPKNKISGRRDVAIKDGRIAAVSNEIPAAKALKTVNVAGLYVTPGLVDLHVHVFAGTGTAYTGPLSVRPDDHSFRSGVTTMVDAGSSGWRNFEDFKKLIIDPARTRVLAMLNIVGAGMAGAPEQNLQDMDPGKAAEMAAKHRDIIVGVKTAHYAGPEWTPVENAVKAAETAGLPVMVDFGRFRPERPFEDLVTKRLRPGDIYTHMFLSMVPMLDDSGHLRPFLLQARKRGVLFDVGHGGGSFLFRQAVPAIKQGFFPDSISTDLHVGSMNGPMTTMLTTLSKFINMGMTLEDVILRATWNPARQIKREDLGHLSIGAPADIAVLRLAKGAYGFVDVNGARMQGTQKLEGELTTRDGKVVWDLNGITRSDWTTLGHYEAQGDPRWDGVVQPENRARR
jgi:dihydroorotase